MKRGEVWTVVRGGSQHRVLVISADEVNAVDALPIWVLTITRDVPGGVPSPLAVQLVDGDPLAGAFVRVFAVGQVLDRTSLRDRHGFVSHRTMETVERRLRGLLELS